MKSVITIESALLQKTCDHFHVSHWKPFITYVLGKIVSKRVSIAR